MRVLFFAGVRARFSLDEFSLDSDRPLSCGEFWERLAVQFPGVESFRGEVRLARNREFIGWDEVIEPDDEVALIPPVSGG